jgi:alkylhydroperoxidase family enzyme
MQEGLTDEQVLDMDSYEDSKHFSRAEKLALEYADRITLSDRDLDEEFVSALQGEFPEPAQIVELSAIVAFENFRSKFNHSLLVESNGVRRIRLNTVG